MRSWRDTLQRPSKVLPEKVEVPFDTAGAADHHVIRSRKAIRGNDFPRKLPEAPLHAVACDGVPDLATDGEAHAFCVAAILPVADEEHESGRRGAPSGVRREEIRAFL